MKTQKWNLKKNIWINFTLGFVDQISNKLEYKCKRVYLLKKKDKMNTGVKKILTELETLVLQTIVILKIRIQKI